MIENRCWLFSLWTTTVDRGNRDLMKTSDDRSVLESGRWVGEVKENGDGSSRERSIDGSHSISLTFSTMGDSGSSFIVGFV